MGKISIFAAFAFALLAGQIAAAGPLLHITDYATVPSDVYPGTHGYLQITLENSGDIYAAQEAGAPPWEILLEHPDDPERAIGKVLLNGKAIAGSAPNRRKWGEFHHLLNAKTGLPAKGAKAIFVTAKTGIEADAYATAIFTAGFEEGIALSKRLPVEMLFISDKGKMYQSAGFEAELFG